MREFSLVFDGDALGWEKLVPVDGLVNANGAQAVEAVQLDVRGEDMHGVVTIRNRDEEVKDISFIFLVPLRCLSSSLPLLIPLVSVFSPVLIGFFHVSHVRLALCQIFALLFEGLELLLIVTANFLIFLRNSSQSLCDEEELLSSWGPVSFKSGTYGARRELQLTELCRNGHDSHGDWEGFLSVDHWGLGR